MSSAEITIQSHPKDQPIEQLTSAWSPLWQRITLGAVMLISVFMEFFQLGQNGFANPFYASGVRSMLDSWHNFFFASYDPGGFVTIDKPAFGLWLQAISAKIFGFSAFSVYLPQALAAVLSVLILYHLIRRHFGVTAGLLAALALAITPLSVVTSRNNTIDSTLVFSTVVGAWAVLKATETGKLRWLLLCAVAIGIGYNIKMTEVFLVVPAFGLLYLLAAPKKIWTRIWHLVVTLLVMLVIALSWSVVVDLTPASQRPYVGSTQDNSEISLAIGYNGLQRILGESLFKQQRNTNEIHPARQPMEAALLVRTLPALSAQLARSVFLAHLWLVRSPGSYRLHFSVCLPLPGNAVYVSAKIESKCRWFCGEPGC